MDIAEARQRYIRLFGAEAAEAGVVQEIERSLAVALPADFKEIAEFYSGGMVGGISHHAIAVGGPATNILDETTRLRITVCLPTPYIVIAEPPESVIVLNTLASDGAPAVFWIDANDIKRLERREQLRAPQTWPFYYDFFMFLLTEEEQERTEPGRPVGLFLNPEPSLTPEPMKTSIIGGAGLVGSCAAFALQMGRVVREIALLDVNAEAVAGQALDLLHGASLMADQVITSGGYEHIPSSDVICITAGLRRKPDESRLDLINRNVDLFVGILGEIARVGHKKDAVVLVVSNPVDVLTYLAAQRLDLPPTQVIGLGTQLDTIRFRSLIADRLGLPATQLAALILGEHGDSMVPIWSSATAAGLPLEKFPGWNPNLANELFTRTKGSGAEVIKKKGGAGFAVGLAIQEVIESIALDRRRILPVSSVQAGCYGIRDVALSVPTSVGRRGVHGTHEIELWPKEVQALRKSGQVLRQTVETVLARIGGAAK